MDNPAVILLLDFNLAIDPPPAGTLVTFTNGMNLALPGWFAGTILDPDSAAVSGPFTGPAKLLTDPIEVETIPEPVTLLLLGGRESPTPAKPASSATTTSPINDLPNPETG